jgi:acetoacetate decarboxylase
MPLTSPAFPSGPYRFVDREYLIVTYRTDPDALRAIIPAPLEMVSPTSNTNSSICRTRPDSARTLSLARLFS